MITGEKLKALRTAKGLSQEKVAEKIGVSRQAVTKWENNQSAPSTENLIALAEVYGVSLDELVLSGTQDTLPDKKILHTNLTLIAIIMQASFLNAATIRFSSATGLSSFAAVVPLLLCSIWMSYNLNYEKNLIQRKKNTKIELVYCIIQAFTALMKYYNKIPFGTLFILANAFIYIFVVNPKFMNRTLTQKKTK